VSQIRLFELLLGWSTTRYDNRRQTSFLLRKHRCCEMPKTIQDAISVSHGYESLWVDASCNIQDSNDDKIVELDNMAIIYKAAHCTLAVMSVDAATEDFLSPRNGKESAKTWNIDNPRRPAVSCTALPKSLDHFRKFYYKHCFTVLGANTLAVIKDRCLLHEIHFRSFDE
jgi:hypothetical protein